MAGLNSRRPTGAWVSKNFRWSGSRSAPGLAEQVIAGPLVWDRPLRKKGDSGYAVGAGPRPARSGVQTCPRKTAGATLAVAHREETIPGRRGGTLGRPVSMIGGRHRRFGWTDLIRPSVHTGAPSPKGEGLHLIPPPLHNLSPTATKALSTKGVPSPRSAPSQRQRKTRGGVSTEPLQSQLRLPDWRSRKTGSGESGPMGTKCPSAASPVALCPIPRYSRRSPAKRVRREEEEQGNERSFRRWAETEWSGLCDDEPPWAK